MYKIQNNHGGKVQLNKKGKLTIEIPEEENQQQKPVLQQMQLQNDQMQAFYRYGKNSPSGRQFPVSVGTQKIKTTINGKQHSGQTGTPKDSNSGTPKKNTNSQKSSGKSTPKSQNKKQAGFNFPLNTIQKAGPNPFLKKHEVPSIDNHKSPSPYVFTTNSHPTKITGYVKSSTPKASQNNANNHVIGQQRISFTPNSKVRPTLTQSSTGGRSTPTQYGNNMGKTVKSSNQGSIQTAKNTNQNMEINFNNEDQQTQESSRKVHSFTPKAAVTKNSVGTKKTYSRQQEVNSSTPSLSNTLQQEKLQQIQKQQLLQQQKQQIQMQRQNQQQQQLAQQQQMQMQQQQQQQENASINQFVTKVNIQQNSQMQKSNRPELTPQQIAQRSEEIYREHLFQTFQAMKFVQTISPADPQQIKNKRVYLPKRPTHTNKKTIVFDLDETLVHCCDDLSQNPDVILPVTFPTGEVVNAGINIRPYARECIMEANQCFEVIIFTASHQCYADVVLDHLDPTGEFIHHRLYRESCVVTDGIYIKDLRILANRNLKDLIIVDNAAYSFGYQIDNGIPIISWHDDRYDRELYNLIDYLKVLSESDDIRDVNKRTFHLRTFYEDYLREFVQGASISPKSKKSPTNRKA